MTTELQALGQSGGKAQPVIDLRAQAANFSKNNSGKGSRSPLGFASPKFMSPRGSPPSMKAGMSKGAAPMPDMGKGLTDLERRLLGSPKSSGRGNQPYRR